MSSLLIGVCSLCQTQTASIDKVPLKVVALAAAVAPSPCFYLRNRRGVSTRSLALVASAIATPNSVLIREEAFFKGLGGRSFTNPSLGNDELEEEDDGCEEGDMEDHGPAAEEANGAGDELPIANLGAPQQLGGSLKEPGITYLFPIQVGDKEEKVAGDIKLHAVPTTTLKHSILRDLTMDAMQPRAVRKPWYLSSSVGTFLAAAYAMQLVPSKALARLCDATSTEAALVSEGSSAYHHFQRLVLMDLDPTKAKLAISIIGPLLSAYGFLFILRIVMSWYPKLPVSKFPYVAAYAPTEPVLIYTRKLIPPLGGVDVTPVVWFGLISFLNEILVGPQGLLVLLSQQV